MVCYHLDNTSKDVTWTISPIVLWAGTEINLGVVTACLPSLRPIFLFVTKGFTRPEPATKGSQNFNNTSAFRNKAYATFASKGRNVRSFSEIGAEEEEEHHPFSIMGEGKDGRDKRGVAEETAHDDSNIDLEELQPPQDKVVVRQDIYVNY